MRLFNLKTLPVLMIASCISSCFTIKDRGECGCVQVSKSTPLLLRTDGLYSVYDTTPTVTGAKPMGYLKIINPIQVINQDIMNYASGSYISYSPLKLTHYTSLFSRASKHKWFHRLKLERNYYIVDSFLHLCRPYVFTVRGGGQKHYIAHFQGEIKNRDTIINWRMVPPFPTIANSKNGQRYNNGFKTELKPKLLYFIQSEELSKLDSLYRVHGLLN